MEKLFAHLLSIENLRGILLILSSYQGWDAARSKHKKFIPPSQGMRLEFNANTFRHKPLPTLSASILNNKFPQLNDSKYLCGEIIINVYVSAYCQTRTRLRIIH